MVFSLLVAVPLVAYGCGDSGGDGTGGGAGVGGTAATGGAAGAGGTAGGGGVGAAGGDGGSGGTGPQCDPLQQDCESGEACYVNLTDGEQSCESVADPGTQGDACQFINVCAIGYGCNLLESPQSSDRVCAFFCDPDGGPPTCANGPGPAYECRHINGFWGDVPDVSLALGMCLDPLLFPEP